MCPDFDDTPLVENHDTIRIFDSRQPVRDHQRGTPLHQSFEGSLHMAFGF